MKKCHLCKAALDGFLHALLLMLLNEAASSPLALTLSVSLCMLGSLIAGLLSTVIYVLFLRHERKSRCVTLTTLLSMAFCVLTLVAGFFWKMSIPLQLLPTREMNAGDGLLLVFLSATYLLFSASLRVCAWIVMCERCSLQEIRQPSAIR